MATVRITERERDWLVKEFGTVNAGLRMSLDVMLANPVRIEPTASAGEPERIGAIFPPRGGWTDESTEEMEHVAVNTSKPNLVIVPAAELEAIAVKAERAHVHKPAVLVSSRHDRGDLLETWECECGTYLPERKAK